MMKDGILFMGRAILGMATVAPLALLSTANANTYVWTGGPDWNDSSNWSPSGGPPNWGDAAFFGGNGSENVTFTSPAYANGLNFQGGLSYTIGSTTGSYLSLASGGYISIESTSTPSQTIDSFILLNGGDVRFSSWIGSSSTLTINNGISGGNSGILALTGNGGNNAINGSIGGGLQVQDYAGHWLLAAANSFTGGTQIANGAHLEYTNTAAFGRGEIDLGLPNFSSSSAYGMLVAGVSGTLSNNITLSASATATGDVFNTNHQITAFTGSISAAASSNGLAVSGAGTASFDGTLSTANLLVESSATVNGSGTLTWNLSSFGVPDLATDNGIMDISGLHLALNIQGALTASQYVLVNYSSGTLVGGNFASVTGLPSNWTINYAGTTQHPDSIVLMPTPVPEPGALYLLAVGGLGLLAARRRLKGQD